MKKNEEQVEFRDGRSYLDYTFCLKQIFEEKKILIHQIHLLLCDLTKAHPNDLITKLWNVLIL